MEVARTKGSTSMSGICMFPSNIDDGAPPQPHQSQWADQGASPAICVGVLCARQVQGSIVPGQQWEGGS